MFMFSDQYPFVYQIRIGRIGQIRYTDPNSKRNQPKYKSLGGGENIAPVPIEDMLRVELEPIISHVMVIGDKRKHLACVITLKTELDEGPEFSKLQFATYVASTLRMYLVAYLSSKRCAELCRCLNSSAKFK